MWALCIVCSCCCIVHCAMPMSRNVSLNTPHNTTKKKKTYIMNCEHGAPSAVCSTAFAPNHDYCSINTWNNRNMVLSLWFRLICSPIPRRDRCVEKYNIKPNGRLIAALVILWTNCNVSIPYNCRYTALLFYYSPHYGFSDFIFIFRLTSP